jgi:transglutaminase-like putative cysteine protease
MSFAQLHKWIAYLISGLGLLALSLGSELSDITLAAIALGFGASWFAEGPLLLRPRYTQLWTAAVVGFLLLQVARGVSDTPTLAMAIEFAAFLQISRLWNRRSAVDYQQIAVLAFLHLIAATVLSTNLSYAALFIGFVIATPWMLALSHLRREIEGNYPSGSSVDPAQRNAIERVLSSRRVVGPGFLIGTALLSLPLFAMTLAIFITIPRVGQGFLSLRRDSGQKVAGFGSEIELGGFGVIRDDPTVVLRVLPQPRIDEKAARVSLRMRGTSFDRYDGRRWTRTHSEPQFLRSGWQGMRPLRRLPDERDRRMQIVLDHLEEPVIFLPEGTVAISVPPRVSSGQSINREITHAPGLDVRYDDVDGLGLVYTAFVSTDPAEADIVPIAPERKGLYLRVPPGHERVAELARHVIGDATTAGDKALRIEGFLKHGQYTYSLKQPDVGKHTPLEAFLLINKRGHCEYFSSAMAIMLRTVGVPTRNVTGFVGGRFNPYGGYYALRQGDAHSWVEAYEEGRGWVTYDPTPAARSVVGPSDGLWADVNALVDALRTRWTTSVVGYDLRAQVGMLRKIAQWIAAHRGPKQHRGPHGEDGDESGLHVSDAFKLGLRAGALIALLLGAGFGVRRWLRSPGARKDPPAAQAASLYGELERALRKRGHPRPAAATPLEHAKKLRAMGFAQHADVQVVTVRYLEARYGGVALERAELAELREAISRIKRAA